MAVQQIPTKIVYPESDGKPMADNTKQLEVIVYLYDNLLNACVNWASPRRR